MNRFGDRTDLAILVARGDSPSPAARRHATQHGKHSSCCQLLLFFTLFSISFAVPLCQLPPLLAPGASDRGCVSLPRCMSYAGFCRFLLAPRGCLETTAFTLSTVIVLYACYKARALIGCFTHLAAAAQPPSFCMPR